MILKNDFNSRWWKAPVGILREREFFSCTSREQNKLLKKFSWVEFRFNGKLDRALEQALRLSGFFYVDTLLNFRIALDKVPDAADLKALQANTYCEKKFEILPRSVRYFENERFNLLAQASPQRVRLRYIIWSNDLIAAYPQYCLRISLKNKTQGWFLAAPSEKGLNLTLAMLSNDSGISGMLLYQKALRKYCLMGQRLGWASFSARNSAVLNIYCQLGARFLTAQHCWFWVKPK